MIQEIISVLATVIGVIMAVSGIPQIYRIIKRKSSEDVSVVMMAIVLLGVTVWFVYGIIFNTYPIIIANGVGIVVWGATLVTILKYRKW
jgi:MtN3 and saliva related transmembrane protein